MDFKTRGLTFDEVFILSEEKEKAFHKYLKSGYIYPTYSINLIKEAYNQVFTKESAYSENSGRGPLSSEILLTYQALETYTQIKLLNEATSAFKKGEDYIISFKNGKPEGDLFTLSDVVGSELNKTRTSNIRLPESFHAENNFQITLSPTGEQMIIDNKVYESGDGDFFAQAFAENFEFNP